MTCHQVSFLDECILIDCGIFQGKEARRHSDLKINFGISRLNGVALTHAHVGYIGRLPYLLAAYASIPIAGLAPEQLEDTLKIGFTSDHRPIRKVINVLKKRITPCEYKQWISISDKFRIKFHSAGQILGSAFIEIEVASINGGKGKR